MKLPDSRVLDCLARCARAWGLALLLAGGHAQAGVQVEGTRFIYQATQRDISIGLHNLAKGNPVLVQTWVDDGADNGDPDHARAPFSLTPPLFRMDAEKSQRLRLVYTGESLPKDRESLFWLNVLEVPSQSQAEASGDQNTLRLAVRSRLKLFFRPEGLEGTPEQAAASVTWRLTEGDVKGVTVLEAHNAGAFFVSLSSVAVGGKNAVVDIGDGILAPGATARFPVVKVAGDQSQPVAVTYTYIDDYGGERKVQGATRP